LLNEREKLSITGLCRALGITRQGYYQNERRETIDRLRNEIILEFVRLHRLHHPKMGSRKLYSLAKAELDMRGIGRDKFINILRNNGLLVEHKATKARTTNSNHGFQVYKNELDESVMSRKNGAVVSDITYIRIGYRFYYLSLITEVSSRMIVGFDLSHSLGIDGVIRAMKMAVRVIGETNGMIHHSDRGVQYCSKEYIKLLKSKGIKISMAEKGNPYENAIAERVNGILKLEYKLGSRFNSVESAQKAVKEAVKFYNYERPHWSLNLRTPSAVYESSEKN